MLTICVVVVELNGVGLWHQRLGQTEGAKLYEWMMELRMVKQKHWVRWRRQEHMI